MPLQVTKEDNVYVFRTISGNVFCVAPGPIEGEVDFGLRLASLAYCLECLTITAEVATQRTNHSTDIRSATILAGMESFSAIYDEPSRN